MALNIYSYLKQQIAPICQTSDQSIPDIDPLNESYSDDTHCSIDSSISMQDEPPSVLRQSPRILTKEMMQQISNSALPHTDRIKIWTRAYSLGRDGDSFETMIEKVKGKSHTLLVVETTKGEIFGGYADTPWDVQRSQSHTYYGTGKSFLFSISSNDDLNLYKWTGANYYSQICDIGKGQLAMGGGGAFGFILQENFGYGSSGTSETFGNPPLVKDGIFDVLRFEVYCFISSIS